MKSIFKTNKGNEITADTPKKWEDISLRQYIDWHLLDPKAPDFVPSFLSVFTGIEKAMWMSKPANQTSMAYQLFGWMNKEPMPEAWQQMAVVNDKLAAINAKLKAKEITIETAYTENTDILIEYKKLLPDEIFINEKPVNVKKDLANPATAAIIEIEKAIESNQEPVEALYPGILACIFHEKYSGGSYDSEMAMKLIPVFEKMPAYLVVPIAYFFLELRLLKAKYGERDLVHSMPKRKKRKLTGLGRFLRG